MGKNYVIICRNQPSAEAVQIIQEAHAQAIIRLIAMEKKGNQLQNNENVNGEVNAPV